LDWSVEEGEKAHNLFERKTERKNHVIQFCDVAVPHRTAISVKEKSKLFYLQSEAFPIGPSRASFLGRHFLTVCSSISSLLLVMSNATLNEKMLLTTILFLSNISPVLRAFVSNSPKFSPNLSQTIYFSYFIHYF
jgi:hypothetical protein